MGAAKRDSVTGRDQCRGQDMMGRLTGGHGQLFYAFNLDEVVPADHVVRRIDAVLDLGWIHKELADFIRNSVSKLWRYFFRENTLKLSHLKIFPR
jgi:hypothetical protein